MKQFTYIIKHPDGLNAKNAGDLIKEILKYSSTIKMVKNNKTADARIIFNVLSLSIEQNDSVDFLVSGENENTESDQLKEYLSLNF